MNIQDENPLVSIIVITYNSSKYVLETLESAKAQTYQNIELIVSDDCSTDNTVEICRDWIEKNKDQFIKTELITVEKNTGIASNCNRGAFRSNGIWFKLIAGDDILKANCIEQFVLKTRNNDSKLYLSGYLPFNNEKTLYALIPDKRLFTGNSKSQLKKIIIKGTYIAGFTFFINRSVFEKLNGFSERYPFCEDTPFAIKLLANGYKMDLVKEVLIEYRKHSDGISTSNNSKFRKSFDDHFINEVFPQLKSNKMYLYLWHFKLNYRIYNRLKEKNKLFYDILILLIKLIDPIQISIKLRYIFKIPSIYSDQPLK